MTNIKFLLIGTSLSFIPSLTIAQCVATQDCETLGYTETSCNGGKGVKCPFGNKWACIGITAEQCLELGFSYTCSGAGEIGVGKDCSGKYQGCTCNSAYQYTCSGVGYSGGSGAACGGKYASCTCASGYEWKNGSCQQQLNGAQGDLYYCQGTVVGVRAAGMGFYIAVKDLGYMNWSNASNQSANYIFCNDLKGTLPTVVQLKTIYSSKSSLNEMLINNGGTQLTEKTYWSSTATTGGLAGLYKNYSTVNMSTGGVGAGQWVYHGNYADDIYYVRPILASW